MNTKEIKKKVLRRIKPSQKEKEFLENFIKEVISVANLKLEKYRGDPTIVGSTGKQTWLSGDYDIDLFLGFPKSYKRDDLEKIGMSVAKEIAKEFTNKTKISYAEHPYLQAFVKINGKEFKMDIVPCYLIKKNEEIKSAVDRSPLHLTYIITQLNPSLRDEVRLLKQFCKGIGIYGSDTKTEGISGYILELLAINYGKFENVLKAVSKWEYGQVVDVENHSKKQFDDPLIVIDPVDKKRNASAALSIKNFIEFKKKSKQFLEKPSIDYFFPKKKHLTKTQINELKKRETKFLGIVFDRPDVVDDTLYPQIRKTKKRIGKILWENEFKTIREMEWCSPSKCIILFEMEIWDLPYIKKMIGPRVKIENRSKEFLNKYQNYNPFVEDDKWIVEKPREFKNADDLLRNLLKQKNLRERGFGSKIESKIKKGKIIENKNLWKMIKKDRSFSGFLRKQYF